jgi:signal recognition particle receptor subunit beta
VFVIDSSSDVETMALIQTELESVLKNSSLQGLPLLVILNKADVADAQTADEVESITKTLLVVNDIFCDRF